MSKRQLFLHRLLASALALSLIAGLVLYQPKPAEAATYTFTQTNWAGGQSTSTASHPGDQTSWNKYPPGGPSNGLVGYWTLEEGTGTSTADGSGSGNTGTLTNGPTWTTGRIGKALSFDGSNDYVNMGDAGAVEGLSAISFGAWVNLRNYVASGQGAGIVISKIYGAGGYGGNSFDISFGDTYLTTDVYAAGSIDYANVGRTIVPLNSWTHIEVTWQSGSPLKLYVNGAQVASGSYSLSGTTHNVGSPLLVGAADSTSVYGFLDGLIDEVRIYNRALSASEVTDLYNATAQNFNITAVNSGADLRIATSTASSTTQTDDGTTNTGFNLAGKAFSNATTTGTGAGTDVRLALQSTSFSTSTLETGPSYYATSLALNSNGFPRILYRSQDGGGNYLRLMICNNISCSSSSSVTISTNVYPGLHSLVLAPDDTPRFAVPQFGGNTYNFYKCNNTDCSGGNFTNNAFDSGVVVNGVMTKASMALGSDGNARIAYYDETNTRLKFAKCNDATCSTSTISVVDSQAGFDIGSLPSMALGPDGFARISYNTGSSTLRFARCLNDACSSVATTTVVASGITNSYASYIALAPNDLPRISYLGSGIQLNYLQCNDVDCASISTTSNIFCAWWGCGSHSAPLVLDSSNFARMAPAVGANVWEQYYLRCTNASCSTRATSTIDSGAGGYQSIAIGSGLYQDLVRIIYEPSNGLSLRYAYEVPNYPASGTFTSAAINIGNPAGLWGNLSWNATTTAQTSVTIKARSATNSSMTGATDWASCTNITNGAALSTGGCVTNGNNHQYIQYQATLSTTDATQTPSLNDVTINYQFYGTSGVLTSSAYNSNDAANLIGTLAWDEDTTSPANTTSTLSLRTASSSANLSLMSWTDFTVNTSGCSKTSITVTCGASAIPSSMKTGADDQWFQYKITLASSNTGNTPTIAEVRVQYVVNAPPQFNPSYGTGGVSVSQNSSSTDSNWGKVQITYQVLDPDTTSGTATPNNVSSSFEYNIGGSWTAVSASNLGAGDTGNKAVSAGTYTQYTATWDAKTQIPNTYYATAQIRQTVNDHEAANNTAIATSSAFILDTKNPSSTMTLNGASSTFTYTLTDDSNISFTLSNNSNLSADGLNASSGILQSLSATSTSATVNWTLATSSYPTVYLNVRDIYGNSVTSTAVAPTTPSSMDIKDVSNVTTNSYSNFISWGVYSSGAGATFSNYRVFRSTNGGSTYSLLTTITDINTNYYRDASLSSSTTYYYKTTITDTDNDVSSFSASVNHQPVGSGGTDLTPPAITNVTVTSTQATWARITWTTDELSTPEINYSASSTAYNLTASSTSYLTSHDITLSGLTPNTLYYFRVRSTDIEGNRGTNDNGGSGFTFTTLGGPIISDVTTESVTDNSATIIWNTNVAANSAVVYAQNTTALRTGAGISEVSSSSPVTGPPYQHRISITGLTSRTTYYYYPKVTASSDTTTDTNSGNYYSFRTAYDTKPPVITNVTTTVVTKNSAVITWQTDEDSSSQADYGTAAGSYTNATTPDSLLSITHSATIIGLARTTTYYFRVRSIDAANNEGISAESSFRTTEADTIIISTGGAGGAPPPPPKDTTPPKISDIQAVDISAFGATIKYETDETSIGFLAFGKDTSYGGTAASSDYKTSHEIKLSGLRFGTDYHFKVKAQDKDGNSSTSDDKTFTTKFVSETLEETVKLENISQFQENLENVIESVLPSLVPPFIGRVEIDKISEVSAAVAWRSNIPAYGSVAYAPESEYDEKKTPAYTIEINTGEKKTRDHEAELANLSPSTIYHLQVKAFVIPGAVGKSKDYTFATLASKIKAEITRLGNTELDVRWVTPAETNSFVEYKDARTGKKARTGDEAKTKTHSITLLNLTPDTTYELRVFGYDQNNILVEGDPVTVKTKKDVTPPAISGLRIDNALLPGRTDKLQSVISWRTDEPANSTVRFEEGIGVGDTLPNKTGQEKEYTTDHIVIITNFKPSTVYRIQIVSADEAGNLAKSNIRSILTPRSAESVLDVITRNLQDTFGFLRKLQQ